MNPNEWIISGDTGRSSKTIWAVMMGVVPKEYPWYKFDTPGDPADFGRCYRLLQHFSEWKERLSEVAKTFPEWTPLVREWDSLTALWEEEIKNEDGRAPKLYDKMKKLNGEGRELLKSRRTIKVGEGVTIESNDER